jgi:hypothetical protein
LVNKYVIGLDLLCISLWITWILNKLDVRVHVICRDWIKVLVIVVRICLSALAEPALSIPYVVA